MSLYIYISDEKIRNLTREHLATKHRATDSGFDILTPHHLLSSEKDNYGNGPTVYAGCIVAALTEAGNPAPCLLLPRSSISNTPLRLCNSIGLIDMGYRGQVMAKVDIMDSSLKYYEIKPGTRLFQFVQHNFMPWKEIRIVDAQDELPPAPDNRGTGGFGSTGA